MRKTKLKAAALAIVWMFAIAACSTQTPPSDQVATGQSQRAGDESASVQPAAGSTDWKTASFSKKVGEVALITAVIIACLPMMYLCTGIADHHGN